MKCSNFKQKLKQIMRGKKTTKNKPWRHKTSLYSRVKKAPWHEELVREVGTSWLWAERELEEMPSSRACGCDPGLSPAVSFSAQWE